uniref:Uncharacterized protein n=1 Tax=Arundo donax TaxID=35708 RepID=A0A0A8YCC2_ARUDO
MLEQSLVSCKAIIFAPKSSYNSMQDTNHVDLLI